VTVRIAVLTSQGAPGLDALLRDPARGPIYEITAVVSVGQDVERPPRNLREREEYDAKLLARVGDADYLFLNDYRHLVTRPLLDAFPGRIIVLHDGDLTAMTKGRRAYTGLHAVRNAILSGDAVTRATAFVATEETGEGPLLLLGPPYPVSELAAAAVARADLADVALYAHLHRRWMVHDSYGVLLRKAAELISLGTMHIAKDTVWVDGVPGPCRLGDAPAACWSATSPPRRGIPSSCPFIQTEVLA
jgi:folate-dependent phosphoribosylglycinamide formyltransferase PurN